ncbi:MAG: RidA family protein [Bacteroidota bacterium]
MQKTIINPWQWQYNLGYSQAIEIKHSESTLYCAGQASMNADGVPVAGSMADQIRLSCQNLEEVIDQAGYEPGNIVRLNIYTTSIPLFFEAYEELLSWLRQHKCAPSSTLSQVQNLAFPQLSVELEATVVK